MKGPFTQKPTAMLTMLVKALITVLVSMYLLTGCVSHFIAKQMIKAPNQSLIGDELKRQFSEFESGYIQLLNVQGVAQESVYLASEDINVSYLDIAAGDYGYQYETTALRTETGRSYRIDSDWYWSGPDCSAIKLKHNDRGVLVMLHGWGRNNLSLLTYGLAFAQAGYRVIIPNLRGHGTSSGEYVSFGAQESKDVLALLDTLDIEQYDLFGFSLGASTALHMAAKSHEIGKLVIVAPMHSLEQTIPKFMKQAPQWLATTLAMFKESALDYVNEIGGYNYQHTSNSVNPAKQSSTQALYIYGSVDNMSGFQLNHALSQLGDNDNQLHELPGLRHTHVLLHQSALIAPIADWLELDAKSLQNDQSSICVPLNYSLS